MTGMCHPRAPLRCEMERSFLEASFQLRGGYLQGRRTRRSRVALSHAPRVARSCTGARAPRLVPGRTCASNRRHAVLPDRRRRRSVRRARRPDARVRRREGSLGLTDRRRSGGGTPSESREGAGAQGDESAGAAGRRAHLSLDRELVRRRGLNRRACGHTDRSRCETAFRGLNGTNAPPSEDSRQ